MMKEYNVSFEITQLANSPIEAANSVNELLHNPNLLWIYNVQEMYKNKISSVDLAEEEDSQEIDISDTYYPQIIGNKLYPEYKMLDFAYNFYHDLSRKNNVPENLISENFTLVEEYFKETFNK